MPAGRSMAARQRGCAHRNCCTSWRGKPAEVGAVRPGEEKRVFAGAGGSRHCHVPVCAQQVIFQVPRWGQQALPHTSVRPTGDISGALMGAAGIATYQRAPNRAAEFHTVLDAVHPTIAVFERFTSEEAVSFRVRQCCPACLLVLDTQDLHFLRVGNVRCHAVLWGAMRQAGRQQVVSEGGSIRDALHHVPDTSSRELLRELASMHRRDLTLAELALLARCYAFPPHKLALASLFYDSPKTVPGGAVGGGAVGGGADSHPPSSSSSPGSQVPPPPVPTPHRPPRSSGSTVSCWAPFTTRPTWTLSPGSPPMSGLSFAPRSAHSRPGPPIRAHVRPFAPRSAHSRPGPPIRP
ncbi:unnamed protein product [Closterium sp. NIES-64]|nr:unnamed protein product [Closterium sp. NIES-64]